MWWKFSGALERRLERAKGIEPSYRAWEALVLPLNYARDVQIIIVTSAGAARGNDAK